jgi:2'-5' RNA ligase
MTKISRILSNIKPFTLTLVGIREFKTDYHTGNKVKYVAVKEQQKLRSLRRNLIGCLLPVKRVNHAKWSQKKFKLSKTKMKMIYRNESAVKGKYIFHFTKDTQFTNQRFPKKIQVSALTLCSPKNGQFVPISEMELGQKSCGKNEDTIIKR